MTALHKACGTGCGRLFAGTGVRKSRLKGGCRQDCLPHFCTTGVLGKRLEGKRLEGKRLEGKRLEGKRLGGKRLGGKRKRWAGVLAAGLIIFFCQTGSAYSVLTHEAIIDSTWDSAIKPLLLKRFPASTAEDLTAAHAYAYGGSIIQDLGYYPFGRTFYSDLTHYVRSGDFIGSMIRTSQDLN